MNTNSFTITKESVYHKAMRLAEYTGTKIPENQDDNGDVYDRITITDHDRELLDGYWETGVGIIQDRLKNLLCADNSTNAAYIQEVELSRGFDGTKFESAQQNVRDFLTSYIVGQWFTMTNKGDALEYFTNAEACLTSAERVLYSRKKPTLPTD